VIGMEEEKGSEEHWEVVEGPGDCFTKIKSSLEKIILNQKN